MCIGAACVLSDVEKFLREVCRKEDLRSTQVFRCILEMLDLFAGTQIRNVAVLYPRSTFDLLYGYKWFYYKNCIVFQCLGGNIMTASPISDLNPILVACGAKLTFVSEKDGFREVKMDASFFTGYRKTATAKNELLLHLKIPFLHEVDFTFVLS